ncbi:MAG: iron-sulfur cluster assembly protein, partial [Xanthobacteraceae bacterium]
MAVEKTDVLTALARVKSPEGAALPATGKLSDVIVTDGKVFFSITVDAALVPSWEPVRKAAEAAVRAVPGVISAMVALTGERAAGPRAPTGGPAARPSPAAPP